MEKSMEKIVQVAKARGFVYPGSEIYGGLANTWDYGNLGVELKNNVKRAWWQKFIQENPYNVGVDCAILMNPQTWVASGHLGGFSDPLMDCKECHERFRADKIIEVPCGTVVYNAETGEYITFGKFYDRGYPDYDYPVVMNDVHLDNYRNVVAYHVREKGSVQEKFNVGELDQIAMTHKPSRYSDLFSIRNIAANAEVWTGEGSETIRYYDLNTENITGRQHENTKSLVLRMDYGPFSYYTGGDVAGSLLDENGNHINVEAKTGEACGEVDVCKTNHHAYKDAMTEGFVNAVNPDHYISCAWDIWHTQPELMERMLKQSEGMIFHQFVWPDFLKDHQDASWYSRLYTKGEHIVVKAFDKGRQYMIYVLDDTTEAMLIKDVFGPFSAE